ncbi:MAG: NINE protein [Bacteroidales bacterium]|nr:NINE protein [Bacteroidales bacterium]
MTSIAIKCPACNGDRTIATGINQYTCQYCGTSFINATQQPAATQTVVKTHCQYCGGEIVFGAQKCCHCGEWLVRPATSSQRPTYVQTGAQQYSSSKSRVVAALLALFLGGLGIHEFYLGKTGTGVAFLLITLLTSWLVFPVVIIGIICLIQAISYLCMSEQSFNEKYQ